MNVVKPKWRSPSLWPGAYPCPHPRTILHECRPWTGQWQSFHGGVVLARNKGKGANVRTTRNVARDGLDGRRRLMRRQSPNGSALEYSPQGTFSVSVTKAFQALEVELRETRPYDGFDMTPERFWDIFREFENAVQNAASVRSRGFRDMTEASADPEVQALLRSTVMPEKLIRNIKIALYNRVMSKVFSQATLDRQKELTDCRYPMEWYPRARLTKRVLHLHVGPTNSGKTYQALKRLESAEVGCYAGPLRLLAQEIYGRMNARGKATWLVTGDDQQVPSIPHDQKGDNGLTSCTVEMVAYDVEYDVAVIDEVQMAADARRGHAWTAAIIGISAKELHLCGEERTVPLIQEIARSLGEELHIHRYERLSPLAVADSRLQNMALLQKGDCIVCFSVVRIHAMKRYIEKMTGKRVAIIYGGLPPEVRAQQARLFNEPNNGFDFLVASDAIGMGLNLAISRIIFDAVAKMTKAGATALTTPEIRQIGGRAGRYRTSLQDGGKDAGTNSVVKSAQKVGIVTAFEAEDLRIIRKSMNTDPEPIAKFGIFPTQDMIEMLCTYFPTGIPYSFILARILEISRVSSRYFFCELGEPLDIADLIQNIKNLSIAERVKICFAPVPLREEGSRELIKELATVVANQTGGELLSIKAMKFELLDREMEHTRGYLQNLETLHKALVLYLWMSFRFPGVFVQRPLAIRAKMLVEEKIELCLSGMQYGDIDAKRVRNNPTPLRSNDNMAKRLDPSEEEQALAAENQVDAKNEADEEADMQEIGARDSANDDASVEQDHEMDVLHKLQERHQSGDDLIEKGINKVLTPTPTPEANAPQ